MARIISKKRIAAGLFALTAGLILAGCDPISATPASYTDPIVMNKDGSEVDLDQFLQGEGIDENIIGKIYDAIATDRNSKIVDKLLKVVSDKMYGSYADIMAAYAAKDETGDDKKPYNDYVAAHASVFDAGDEALTKARFEYFVKDISDRISEQFYNEITSGSYNDDDGKFDEAKFFMAHYYEFYDIAKGDANFFVTKELTKENALDSLNGTYSLTEVQVAANKAAEADGKSAVYRGYIDDKIFPQIIKDKMVEEYIVKENKNALGRAYARQVKYIKVSYENDVLPTAIMHEFATNYIEKAAAYTEADNNEALDYNSLSDAFNGFDSVDVTTGVVTPLAINNGSAIADMKAGYTLLINSLGFGSLEYADLVAKDDIIALNKDVVFGTDVLLPSNGVYFKATKLGELVDKINKARDAVEDGRFAASEDKSALDSLVSGNKSLEYNVRKEIISIANNEIATEGWFVKNGGLSDLPSELRDRLFNINVAHVLDDKDAVRYEDGNTAGLDVKVANADGHYALGAYEFGNEKNNGRTPYLRNINGRMFVIPSDVLSYEKDKFNYVYQDVSGKAFYIVQVFEAPSTPKMNADNADYYGAQKTEEVQRSIAKVLGTKDNYIKDAYTEYLDQFCFEYYETSFRDYFESEYPDLFPDED